jgi:Tfp pilus assembly protein PilE
LETAAPTLPPPSYNFSFVGAVGQRTYTIQAVPQNNQTNDTQCGSLSINNAGVKTVLSGSTTAANVHYCWK